MEVINNFERAVPLIRRKRRNGKILIMVLGADATGSPLSASPSLARTPSNTYVDWTVPEKVSVKKLGTRYVLGTTSHSWI